MDGAVGREAYPYGVACGLQSGVGQRSGLVCQGAQLGTLGLRHFAGAVEGKRSRNGGIGIVLVDDAQLHVFLAGFGSGEVHHIPESGVGILVVAARPVEADSGLAGCARILLFQLHLESKGLISGQTDIDGVVRRGDIVEQVARDEFLVGAAYADGQAALGVGDRVGAVEAESRMNGYGGGAAILDADVGQLVKHTQAVHAHFVPNGVAGVLLAAFRHIEDHCAEAGIIGRSQHHVLLLCADFHLLVGSESYIDYIGRQHTVAAVAEGLRLRSTDSQCAGSRLQVNIRAGKGGLCFQRSFCAREVLYRENDILHVGLCLGDINGIPYGGVRLLGMAVHPVELSAVFASITFVHVLQAGGEINSLRGNNTHIDVAVLRADAVHHVLLDVFHKALSGSDGYRLLYHALWIRGQTYLCGNGSGCCAGVCYSNLGHNALAAQRVEMNLIDLLGGNGV